MTDDTEGVAVLGAGTMGRGIAHAAAVVGHDVTMRDVDESVLDEAAAAVDGTISGAIERGKLDADAADAARDRVRTTTDLGDCADATVVIEAVPEDLDLKTSVLGEAEAVLNGDALLTSNTSSLPVTELAASLDEPGRFCGLHFFNPAYVMGLVEVVTAEQTAEGAREHAVGFVESLRKEAVVVRDAPGFASSRLGVTTMPFQLLGRTVFSKWSMMPFWSPVQTTSSTQPESTGVERYEFTIALCFHSFARLLQPTVYSFSCGPGVRFSGLSL